MFICQKCLAEKYMNKVFNGATAECEECHDVTECASIEPERLIKKSIHTTIMSEEKPTSKLSTKSVELVAEMTTEAATTTKTRKTRVKKDPVQLLEAEEVPHTDLPALTTIIDKTLAKNNITEKVLLELEAYKNLTIKDLSDKEGYVQVEQALKISKQTRIITTKLCKVGRDEAIKIQKAWITEEKRVVDRVSKVEEDLEAKLKVIDDEKAKIDLARQEKEQALLQTRSVNLINLGMHFTGEHYELDGTAYGLEHIKISALQIKTLDNFVFTTLVSKVESIFLKQQELKKAEEDRLAQIEADNKRLIEEARLREEDLKKKEFELQEQQRLLREKEELLKKQEEDRLMAEQNLLKKAADDLLRNRRSALFALGFAENQGMLVFDSLMVSDQKLKDIVDFEPWLKGCMDHVAKIKARKEEELIAAEEQKHKDIESALIRRQNEEKQIHLVEEARIASLAPDKDKLNTYLKTLWETKEPDFATDAFKSLGIRDMLSKFIKHIQDKQPK